MARLRAASLLLALCLLVLAGCSSPPAPAAEDPTAAPSATDAAPPPAPEASAASPPAVQEADLAWSLGTHGCAEPPQAWDQVAQAYRPELDGVTYQAVAIDEATRGGHYDVTFQVSEGTFAVALLFWGSSVGPDGTILEAVGERYTMFSPSLTFSGDLPSGAKFVTASSCGPLGSTAHVLVERATDALALLT